MAFQNITGVQLGQAAITTSYATLFTTSASTRTFLKSMDICNTTAAAIEVYVHIIPSGGSATTSNAIIYKCPVASYGFIQWNGCQIINAGGFVQVKASAVGCTITASGGEAV